MSDQVVTVQVSKELLVNMGDWTDTVQIRVIKLDDGQYSMVARTPEYVYDPEMVMRDWGEVLKNAPGSWDQDAAAPAIAIEYVRELERRVRVAGGSLERYPSICTDQCPSDPHGHDETGRWTFDQGIHAHRYIRDQGVFCGMCLNNSGVFGPEPKQWTCAACGHTGAVADLALIPTSLR